MNTITIVEYEMKPNPIIDLDWILEARHPVMVEPKESLEIRTGMTVTIEIQEAA